jgi:putative transposase
MNQMLINVATRKFARSVRLPEGDVPAPAGAGLSKSAASRRFVALSAARMKDWMTSDLAALDLLVIQIDGIHMAEDLIVVAAIGVDAKGDKHPPAWPRVRRRTPQPSKRLSIIWSSAASTRRAAALHH